MRVSMKYNGVPTSCETFTYGEVEDYTVNITSGSGKPTERSEVSMVSGGRSIIYPNPVKDYLAIQLEEGEEVRSLTVSTMNGVTLQFTEKYEQELNVSGLSTGIYILSVQTDRKLVREKFRKE